MRKKYMVSLSQTEREALERLVKTGNAPARKLTRVWILLKSNVNEDGPNHRLANHGLRLLNKLMAGAVMLVVILCAGCTPNVSPFMASPPARIHTLTPTLTLVPTLTTTHPVPTTVFPNIETTTSTPLGTEEPYPPTSSPTVAPSITEPATATPIPTNWKTFSDPTLKIKFRYPPEWQVVNKQYLGGKDGFVEVSLLDYHASLFDVMRTVCVLEANTGRPAAYGAGPLITDWQGWDTERQTWAGSGCTVMPSDGMPPDGLAQAVLFTRYPPPQMADKLLVLRADDVHFSGILSTLRFQDYTPPVNSNGYYNSPACEEAKVGPPQVALRTETLVITETAIANKDCDPWLQFDGFQNLVNSSGVQAVRISANQNNHWVRFEDIYPSWVGADNMGFEYASAPLSPVDAPAKVNILRKGQVLDSLAVAQAGPAGFPVHGFWSWKGHWLLEMDSVVVQDGELLNNTFKYAEIFEWHLMKDEPFYFYYKDSSYGISYAGLELPLRYDDIIHGQLCCDPGVYSIISTSSGAWFYALKGDLWYMVQAQLK